MKSQQPANSMVLIPIGKMISLEDEKKNYRCCSRSPLLLGDSFYLQLFLQKAGKSMSNELLQALQLLKSKQWVDLTHTFGPNSPHFLCLRTLNLKRYFLIRTVSSLNNSRSLVNMAHISTHPFILCEILAT